MFESLYNDCLKSYGQFLPLHVAYLDAVLAQNKAKVRDIAIYFGGFIS